MSTDVLRDLAEPVFLAIERFFRLPDAFDDPEAVLARLLGAHLPAGNAWSPAITPGRPSDDTAPAGTSSDDRPSTSVDTHRGAPLPWPTARHPHLPDPPQRSTLSPRGRETGRNGSAPHAASAQPPVTRLAHGAAALASVLHHDALTTSAPAPDPTRTWDHPIPAATSVKATFTTLDSAKGTFTTLDSPKVAFAELRGESGDGPGGSGGAGEEEGRGGRSVVDGVLERLREEVALEFLRVYGFGER